MFIRGLKNIQKIVRGWSKNNRRTAKTWKGKDNPKMF